MVKSVFTVVSNEALAGDVYKMILRGDVSAVTAPGQFVNLELEGFFLRRPFSVCDVGDGLLTIVYKVVGRGTLAMSRMAPGGALDLLTGLGNGYDVNKSGSRPLLIGGGAGTPPMYLLARRLLEAGREPKVILGFNSAGEVFMEEDFAALGIPVFVTTADGSRGIRGFVTDALPKAGNYDYTFACGPEPMLRAVYERAGTGGQFSFEERMGCGFGACMGCSCKTKYGYKRVCREGPVLEKEEIIW